MFYVYILQSEVDSKLYIGMTEDLKRRLSEHNSGRSAYTKKYLPWNIIYYESHTNQKDVIRRERYLKTTQGHRAIRNMLREYFSSQQQQHFISQGSTT